MFGMGMTEILVILVIAVIFLGPDKLPEAASKISKGIRDIRKQTRHSSRRSRRTPRSAARSRS